MRWRHPPPRSILLSPFTCSLPLFVSFFFQHKRHFQTIISFFSTTSDLTLTLGCQICSSYPRVRASVQIIPAYSSPCGIHENGGLRRRMSAATSFSSPLTIQAKTLSLPGSFGFKNATSNPCGDGDEGIEILSGYSCFYSLGRFLCGLA